jgi:hypothetical protein
MKMEVKNRITHDGVIYEPGVVDLPQGLAEKLMAKWPWAVANLQRVQLVESITHDGKEYKRGIHDLTQSLARHFLETAPHAAIPFIEPTSVKGDKPFVEVPAVDQTPNVSTSSPKEWQDVEISFLSEFQLQIRNQEPLNYAELGFADRRGGKQKPNAAWMTFRKIAESNGTIMIHRKDLKRPKLEKQIQETRNWLRRYFGIPRDPLPFVKDNTSVGYRAEFKISCSSSYEN